MNLRRHVFCPCLLSGILAVSVMGGCGNREQTKTIILPSSEYQITDSGKFRIDHIQEYTGSGYSEEVICMAWGEPGEDILYLLKKRAG